MQEKIDKIKLAVNAQSAPSHEEKPKAFKEPV